MRPVTQQLHVGDLVLLHNTVLQHSHSNKLDDKWRGPFRIREIPENSTFYWLEELDGALLAATLLEIASNGSSPDGSSTRKGPRYMTPSE